MAQAVAMMHGGDIEPDSVHRAIREGQLDVHPTLDAIVVHYQMDAVVVSVYGDPMVADRKESRKLIKVQNLDSSTDIKALAWHITSKCDLINMSRVPEVEQLLSYLQNRNKGKDKDKDVLESSSRQIQEQIKDMQNISETASMSNVVSYLECLYEDMPGKVRGTGLILQLARSPDNLGYLMENESLFLALARVLKEDWKKSMELTTNIVYIFFCFSTFSVFHKILAQHKIGSTCMVVLEHEMKRYKSLQDDLSDKKKTVKGEDASVSSKSSKKEYDKAKKKYTLVLKKQETLLRVVLYLLLNLSEDTRVELKMRNRGLVRHLSTLLERSNQELLILVVSFLKKLSIYVENKNDMIKTDVLKKLCRILPGDNEILVNVSVRLLLNLSFDPNLRVEMVRLGLLPVLSTLLKNPSHRVVVSCILYHISLNKKARFMFSECIPELIRIIVECPDELVDPETIALGINLACSMKNVQIICNGPGLKLLIRRAINTQDSLLLKMIRNIARCPGKTKELFLPFLSELCQLLKRSDTGGDEEVCVEVLGILGNLLLPEVDFHRLVTECNLLPFITSKLRSKGVQDDLLLEVVILCGTFALDEKCANLLMNAGVPDMLITILKAKQEDDEMVLQIVYLFHHLVLHESCRNKITQNTLAPDYLVELMNDKNKEICRLCSKTLDIILDSDPELALKIKLERFRWHNFQWLEMMTGQTIYKETEEPDEEYLGPGYLRTTEDLYDLQGHLENPYYGVEQEYGRNFDPYDENDQRDYSMGLYGSHPKIAIGMDEVESNSTSNYSPRVSYSRKAGSSGTEDGKPGVLSPQQYAKLMASLRDPLTMYSNTLPGQEKGSSNQFDPLELYDGQQYNVSPTYSGSAISGYSGSAVSGYSGSAVTGCSGSAMSMQSEVPSSGEESNPMFTMKKSSQPKPPKKAQKKPH